MSGCTFLLQKFPNIKIIFVMRQENSFAHSLGRVSKLYARYQVFGLIPSYIVSIVMSEIIRVFNCK